MDSSMYALDIGVAVVLAGLMVGYSLYTWREVKSMRVEDAFSARRFFLPLTIAAAVYAVIAIAGLSVSVFLYPPAHWVTMAVLGAFAAVDFIRCLFRASGLRKAARQERSASAAAAAPIVLRSGIWMLVYTLLQAANLFYFT
ncbi:MAG: hypothetical protein HDQ87_05235 [Clostridia bacterium]|nr:hypothetical protein [Clostridia bacterium]